MNSSLDCMPCFIRQCLEAVRLVNNDSAAHEVVMKKTLAKIAQTDLNDSPPKVAQAFHRELRATLGVTDPYLAMKRGMNKMALGHYEALVTRVANADDPLQTAAKIAVSGNIIDVAVGIDHEEDHVLENLERALMEPLLDDFEDFRQRVKNAENILYLTDNAGEFIWDQLLIDQIGPEKITLATRGAPILNDICPDDIVWLQKQGFSLDKRLKVIDNGNDAPGTILSDCSDDFKRVFEGADLIISKGQGNFESLNDEVAPIYFLFMTKCPVVSKAIGAPQGSHLIKKSLNFFCK